MRFDKKTFKKILIILTSIMFIITIYQIIRTYALFQTEKDVTIEIPIAKWNVELNGHDITDGYSQQIVITDFSVIADSNVKPGKIAPGMRGMVDLTIDPVDTDVSVRYDITLGDIGDQPIELLSVEIIEGEGELVCTDTDTFTGVIELDDIKNGDGEVTVRIAILWTNDEANNEIDTQIGTNFTRTLDIPIRLTASQYLGEEIEDATIK